MKIVLLDTATWGEDIDVTPLLAVGEVTEYKQTHPHQVMDRIRDAEVVVLNKVNLKQFDLTEAPSLRLICVSSTGYDTVDTAVCEKLGIALYNVPAYCSDSVSQITLAMALTLATHLTEYRTCVHSGNYTEVGIANRLTPVFHELSSLTWGVVGGGSIGSRVAELATAFGARVLLCRRKPDDRYEQADIDEICRRADIISLHVPLTAETRGMISRERIATMKKGAILINVARGAVTDEAAVADAILDGSLGGLGCDVYSIEPFGKDHPFYGLLGRDNVCLTPHMSWGSIEARARCIETIAKNVRAYETGDRTNRIV